MKSKRERDIDVEVSLYANPMSKHAVEHDMRLSDSAENILVYCNTIIRLASDLSKHLIAKTSSLGWRFVSSLESLEGQVGHI